MLTGKRITGLVNKGEGKESASQCTDAIKADLVPGSGRSPTQGNGNLLQYSCLEGYIVLGGAKSHTSEHTHTPQ